MNFNMLNYNLDNFLAYDLQIELTQLEDEYNLLMVREFSDYEGVSRYASRLTQDAGLIIGEISEDAYKFLLVSKENYERLKVEKQFIPYYLFYRQEYLGK